MVRQLLMVILMGKLGRFRMMDLLVYTLIKKDYVWYVYSTRRPVHGNECRMDKGKGSLRVAMLVDDGVYSKE